MAYNASNANLKNLKKIYSESRSRVIFFLGAGVSTDAGMPLWLDLRETLFNRINDETNIHTAADSEIDTFRQFENLYLQNEYWPLFSHAEKFYNVAYNDVMNDEIVENSLKSGIPTIYQRMCSMRHINQILTLNLDGIAAKALSEASEDGVVH